MLFLLLFLFLLLLFLKGSIDIYFKVRSYTLDMHLSLSLYKKSVCVCLSIYGYKYVIRPRSYGKWKWYRFFFSFKLSKLPGKCVLIEMAPEGWFSSAIVSVHRKPFSHYFSILNPSPCPGWLNLSEMCQAENLTSPLSLQIRTSSHFHGLFWNTGLSFVLCSQRK